MTDPVFLIDISAYLHRAMHVVYGDRAHSVAPTDTAFIDHVGVMLANTMEKLDIKRMAVACDSTEPSFRCEETNDLFLVDVEPQYDVSFYAGKPRPAAEPE